MSSSDVSLRRPFLKTIAVLALFVSVIVGHAYAKLGTVEALRVVTGLVMPLSLIWLFFLGNSIWCFFRRRLTLAAVYLTIWIAMTAVFNQHVAKSVIGLLESRSYDPIEPSQLPLRAVVVLGGGVHMTAHGEPEMNRDGQRVFAAAQLWHAQKTQAIVCTGERASIGDNQSQIARQLLISVGVPNRVIFEIGGENTTQEMRNLQKLLDGPPDGMSSTGDVGLITSAFHMPRAMRLAKQNDLSLLPIPVCYRTSQPTDFTLDQIVPGMESGVSMRLAIKEFLAKLVGR